MLQGTPSNTPILQTTIAVAAALLPLIPTIPVIGEPFLEVISVGLPPPPTISTTIKSPRNTPVKPILPLFQLQKIPTPISTGVDIMVNVHE
jgi:hypothetical protein